jgi:hypothetical protein
MALLHLQCSLQSNLGEKKKGGDKLCTLKNTEQSHTALLTLHNTFHNKIQTDIPFYTKGNTAIIDYTATVF